MAENVLCLCKFLCIYIALKNDLWVNTKVEFVHTWSQAFSDLVALQTEVRKQDNHIFLRNCSQGIVRLMSVFVQSIVDMIN